MFSVSVECRGNISAENSESGSLVAYFTFVH